MKKGFLVLSIVLLNLIFLIGCGRTITGKVEESDGAGNASNEDITKAKSKNEALLIAASPYEDMAEFALDQNKADASISLKLAKEQSTTVKLYLSADSLVDYEDLLMQVEENLLAEDFNKLAANCVNLYRLLVENLVSSKLEMPIEVHLLDYVGFQLLVLSESEDPDWANMQVTVDEAVQWWDEMKDKVTDSALQDTFTSTVEALQEATTTQNLPLLKYATHQDLELVDLLEGFFEK